MNFWNFIHTVASRVLTGGETKPSQSETPDGIRRITISMPEETFQLLDRLVTQRSFDSRSQAMAEMVHQQALNIFRKSAPKSWPAR